MTGPVEALDQLAVMRDRGLITEAEYDARRAAILERLAPGPPPPPVPPAVDRRALTDQYRAQEGWWCLQVVILVGGAVLGWVVGAYVAGSFLETNVLLGLAIGWIIAPAIGAVAGWWLWTELWAKR